jgi:Tc5 transposase DNA-binding domain/DDE superfamily endonuclease
VAGAKYNPEKKTMKDWYIVCKTFEERPNKVVRAKEFLVSDASGSKFSGTRSESSSFTKQLKQYRLGNLQPSDSKKGRVASFPDVESKLVAYINLRATYYKRDKCGLSWDLLRVKAAKFANDLGIEDFKASNGWLNNTLKRHGKIGIRLHGEADDISPNERYKIIDDWKKETFHPLIEALNVPPECIYNADQTGLFYQKLPNRIYVDKSMKHNYAGAKQMKDKTRITLMVCTSADGCKVPLSVVGKPKKPVCFRLCEQETPPMAYKDQKNVWYDTRI